VIRRLLKYLVISLLAALALVLGIATVFWLTFDPNDYRALISDGVSAALDREIAIGGELELVPALVPTVAVNGVTIANAAWASRPIMASVGRLELSLALLPLLERRIEISDILLEQVDVLLERDAEGRGNWELAFLADAPAPTTASEPTGDAFQTQVDHIALRDITARFVEASAGTDIATHITEIILERSLLGRLRITAAGDLQTLPITIDWQAGPLDDEGEDPELRWPVAATVALGDTSLTMSGRLRAPAAFARSDLMIELRGRNAGQLQALIDLPPSEGLVYEFAGDLRIDADSARLTNLRGSLTGGRVFRDMRIDTGGFDITRGVRVEASLAGTASDQPMAVSTRLGRLGEMLERAAPWPVDLAATLGDAALSAVGEVVIADSGASMALDLAVRGEVAAALNRLRPLGLPEVGLVALDTTLLLGPREIALNELRMEAAGSAIAGEITLTDLDTTPRVRAALDATRIDLAALDMAQSATAPSAAVPLRDRPLAVDWLERFNGSLDLKVAELAGLPVSIGDAALSARVESGVLELTAVDARVADTRLNARGVLRNVASAPALELEVDVPALDAAALQRTFDLAPIDGLEASTGSIDLKVSAGGRNLRDAAQRTEVELSAQKIRVRVIQNGVSADIDVPVLNIDITPGGAAHFTTTGRLSVDGATMAVDEAFSMTASAGTLAELLELERLWPVVSVSATSTYHGEPVSLTARVGDTTALIDRRPAAIEATAIWGPAEVRVAGELVPTAGLLGTTANVALETADVTAAAALLGIKDLPAGKAAIAARLSLGDHRITLDEVTARAPGIEITGSASLEPRDRLRAQAALKLALLDLTSYICPDASDANADVPSQAFYERYSNEPFELEPLRRADFDVRATVGLLRLNEFTSNNVNVELALERGVLQLEAGLDNGQLNAEIGIDASVPEPVLNFRLSGDAIPLAVDRMAAPAAGTPVVSLDTEMSGKGMSIRELVASLDGGTALYVRGGRMPDSGIRFLFGSVLYELVDAINPFSQRKDYIDIDCAGAYFDVMNGVLSTRNGILLQTPEIQVVGVGSASLVDGGLQMQFRTKRRTGIVLSLGSIVNEFVELRGTLDAPSVAISAERATRSGLLAIATGGLSLLATDMFGRLTSGDVCENLPARVGSPASDAP
jgi:uncharacterized protein involved in outer membrane biogenesis